jgi:hypothetical protein
MSDQQLADLQALIARQEEELEQARWRDAWLLVLRLECILTRWRESEDNPDDELCASHDAYMRDYPTLPKRILSEWEGAAPGLKGEQSAAKCPICAGVGTVTVPDGYPGSTVCTGFVTRSCHGCDGRGWVTP